MKTLEKIQIEYAKSIGFSDWNDLLKHQVTQKAIHRDYMEVTKRYATEAIKADRERVANEVYEKYNGSPGCKESILNLPIELP